MNPIRRYELDRYRTRVLESLSTTTRAQAETAGGGQAGLSALLGGLDFIGNNLNTLGSNIARMVVMADWALPEIIGSLATVAERLGGIEQMMASPEETRAAEYYRTGSQALVRAGTAGSPARTVQWYVLAAEDLRRAVEAHRYHPKSWYNLGVALARLEQTQEAAMAFSQCAFFGIDDSLVLGATAVLLSAALYRQAGQTEDSADILREYVGQLDRCAEIHLALGVHHGETDHLRRALLLAPHLAADARTANAVDVESVAIELCRQPNGVVEKLFHLETSVERVTRIAATLGLTSASVPRSSPPPTGVEILIRFAAQWPIALANGMQLLENGGAFLARLASAAKSLSLEATATEQRENERIRQARINSTEKPEEIEYELTKTIETAEAIEESYTNCLTHSHGGQHCHTGGPEVLRKRLDDIAARLPAGRPWLNTAIQMITVKHKLARMKEEHKLIQEQKPFGITTKERKWADKGKLKNLEKNMEGLEQFLEKLRQQRQEFRLAMLELRSKIEQETAASLEAAQREAPIIVEAALLRAKQASDTSEQARRLLKAPLEELAAVVRDAYIPESRIIPFTLPGYITP